MVHRKRRDEIFEFKKRLKAESVKKEKKLKRRK